VYAPIAFRFNGGRVRVINHELHRPLSDYRYFWNITVDGIIKKKGELTLNANDEADIPQIKYPSDADVRFNVIGKTSPDPSQGGECLAGSGACAINNQKGIHSLVDTSDTSLNNKINSISEPTKSLDEIPDTSLNNKIKSISEPTKSLDTHSCTSLIPLGTPLLGRGRGRFYRAPTDNDKGFGNWLAKDWIREGLDKFIDSAMVTNAHDYRFNHGSIHVENEWREAKDGSLDYIATFTPTGELPPLPCLGTTFVLPASLTNVSWYGRGPLDSYPDRKEATSIGRWNSTVDAQYVHYPRPQDSGNHEEVTEVTITDSKGRGWRIIAVGAPFSFSALPYSDRQLYTTAHDCDLKPEGKVFLNINAAVMGLGNSSCGPGVLKKYAIPQTPHTLHIRFIPIK
jgi:beta-galactosidase